MRYKGRRTFLVLLLTLMVVGFVNLNNAENTQNPSGSNIKNAVTSPPQDSTKVLDALENLAIKGRAPKTGYDRTMFMDDWREENNCDKRNIILRRDLTNTIIGEDGCTVLSGTLYDPYTAQSIDFNRGFGTSSDVQIDHMVSLSDAWQKGAQQLTYKTRNNFANDPLNLLAVDGPANMQKSDGDAATWLPANKIYRCAFVARQTAVKLKYNLWVTNAEKDAIKRIINTCPNQVLPIEK